MNGLEGRMMHMPAPKGKSRHILFIYGQHTVLEEQFNLVQVLNKYGSITAPDLPGFGGMQSFYKIGIEPSMNSLADYLAAFVKMRYRNRKVTIVASSFGFAVVTRMLQRFPELTKKVTMLVSIEGIVHHEELLLSRRSTRVLRWGASFFSNRLPAFVGNKLILRPTLVRAVYGIFENKQGDTVERKTRVNTAVKVWMAGDFRTYMDTTISLLTLNLIEEKVNLPVYHIDITSDSNFDSHVVEQHLNIIYNKAVVFSSTFKGYGPDGAPNSKQASLIIPAKLKRLLAQKPA